jgi:hypothetical protein
LNAIHIRYNTTTTWIRRYNKNLKFKVKIL